MTYAGQIVVERAQMQARIAELERVLARVEAENADLRRRIALLQSDAGLDSPGYHHQIASGVVGCPLCCETGCDCDTRR